jgi:acyl-CoA thioesterase
MGISPDVDAAIRARLEASEFAAWMGLEVVSFDDGASELRLPLKPHHRNPSGVVHGGVVASLLDAAIGLALRTKLEMTSQHVTLGLDIHYIAISRGDVMTARGRVLRSGRQAAHGEAEVFDEDGTLLAKGAATFMTLRTPYPKDTP